MHTWLSAVQQCMTAETASADAAESQPTEPLVLFFFKSESYLVGNKPVKYVVKVIIADPDDLSVNSPR